MYSVGTMHRYCCRPVKRLRWNSMKFHLNLVTGRQQYRCIVCTNAVHTAKKCSWRWASLSPEICRADSNRSIKRSINENCCIWLVAYIVVLMMHGLTNAKVVLMMHGLTNAKVYIASVALLLFPLLLLYMPCVKNHCIQMCVKVVYCIHN